MESEFRALLTGHAPLAALVSTRIYWGNYPQAAADPAVRLSLVDGAPGYTYQGADGLQSSIVQIDVRALSVTSAWDVRNAIVAKLSGFRGTQGAVTFGLIALRGMDGPNTEKPGTVEYQTFRLDFDVWSSAA